MTRAWELLDERPGHAGYLPISVRRFRTPDGAEVDWDIFGGDRTVATLALTGDGNLVLARQFRPGPGRILDELPGGAVEEHETIEHAAARELLEETGFAGEIEVVGATWLAAGSRTRRYVAVARNARRIAEPQNEAGEFCEVVLRSLTDFRAQLRSGDLTDVDLGYLALDSLDALSART